MKGQPTHWTDEMIQVLTEQFPNTYNKVIAEQLGIGWRTVIRKARELGIEKEEGFLEKNRDEIQAIAIKNRPPNPTKGMRGWSVPNSEHTRYKKGNVPATSYDKELVKSIHESRNNTIRREKLRLKYGMKQLTKLKIVNYY